MPALPPDIWGQIYVDGAWQDLAGIDVDKGMTATRGRSGERDSAGPAQGALTLINTGARYSRRNPNSTLFGKIGLNTPCRYGVVAGAPWVAMSGTADADAYLSTSSSSALNIAGDLELRIELAVDDPGGTGGNPPGLAARYGTAGNRSWRLILNTASRLSLIWSTDGTATTTATSTVAAPVMPGQRCALRVVLDVDNGAGGWTARFYTAKTIDADDQHWQLLGGPVTGSGTTSVFDPTQDLWVGRSNSTILPCLNGRLYRFRMYDSGSLLADLDTSVAAAGATSFTDSEGLLWSLNGSCEMTNQHTLLYGEVSSWEPVRDKSGRERRVSIAPAGISQRLSQGKKALRSPMFRDFTSPQRTGIVAYWPFEEGDRASSIAAAIGQTPFTFTGAPTFNSYAGVLGSDPLPDVKNASFLVKRVPAYTVTGQTCVQMMIKPPDGGYGAQKRVMRVTATGSAALWDVFWETDGDITISCTDGDGTSLLNTRINFNYDGTLTSLIVEWTQDGADLDWIVYMQNYSAATDILYDLPVLALSGTISAQTFGRVTSLALAPDANMTGTAIGHVFIANDDASTVLALTQNSVVGYNGEGPRSRFNRLCEEQGVVGGAAVEDDHAPLMGPQKSAKFFDLLRQVETVEGGILAEDPVGPALAYRGASTMWSQQPVLTLDHSAGLIDDITPKDDTRASFNEVTAKRIDGSEYTYTKETGTNSVAEIGLTDTSVDLSLYTDDDLPSQAFRRVQLATVDEMRYPQIKVNLANERVFAMLDLLYAIDLGDLIRLDNVPDDYGAGYVDLIVVGIKDAVGASEWSRTFVCVPGEPWTAGVLGSGRADTDGSELAAALTASATTATVLTTAETRWVWTAAFPSEFPFDVRAGGETWSVTAINPSISDTFTRTATGWGTADSGQTWTGTGGVAGDHFTQGSRGVHRMTATSSAVRDLITAAGIDHDVRMSVSTDQLATGGDQYVAAVARAVDENNLYMAQLQFSTAAAVTLTLRKRVASVETVLGTWSGGVGAAHTALGRFFIRLQVTGSTVRCRAWAAAIAEPGQWQIIATDTSLTTGTAVGARSVRTAGNTNANLLANWDDFELLNPQAFTISRSVNGVVKAHDAATDVRLARPSYLST